MLPQSEVQIQDAVEKIKTERLSAPSQTMATAFNLACENSKHRGS